MANARLLHWENNRLVGLAVNAPPGAYIEVFAGNLLLRRLDLDKSSFNPHDSSCYFVQLISDELLKLIPSVEPITIRDWEGREIEYFAGFQRYLGKGDSFNELTEKMSTGWHVDKWGALKKRFGEDEDRRSLYARAMTEAAKVFRVELSLDLFIHYGTLLGYGREGRFLGHDDDVDLSFLVITDSIEVAAQRFYGVARTLKDLGFPVWVQETGQLTFVPSLDGSLPSIDIFLSWFEPSSGRLSTYFSVMFHLRDAPSFCAGTLEGVEVLLPLNHEEWLAATYGDDWRVPNPNFQWYIPKSIDERMEVLRSVGKPYLSAFRD